MAITTTIDDLRDAGLLVSGTEPTTRENGDALVNGVDFWADPSGTIYWRLSGTWVEIITVADTPTGLDVAQSGTVTLSGVQAVEVDADLLQADATIVQSGAVTLSGVQSVVVDALQVYATIAQSGSVTLAGSQSVAVESGVEAPTTVDVTQSGSVTLTGTQAVEVIRAVAATLAQSGTVTLSGSQSASVTSATPSGFDILNDIAWHTAFWADDPNWTNPGDGNAVAQWDDGTGNTRHATQATGGDQPIYRASVAALNSQPAVQFDGAGDFLKTATWTELSQPNTIVAVGQWTTTANASAMFDGAITSKRHLLYISGGFWTMNAGANGPQVSANTDPHLFVARYAASPSLEVDGTGGTTQSEGSQGLTGITLGAWGDDRFYLPGYIAFFGVFDGELSAGELSDIETWAADAYGLTIS